MRTCIILAMAMLWPFMIHAQYKGKFTGKIVDAKDKQVLEGATVSVLDSAAGIYIKHAVSNAKGEFTVTSLPMDTALQVIITFTGYRDTTAMLRISSKTKINATGTWTMTAGNELESVTVTARKAPFVVKKDTLEFDATAFKTLPSDMVQDLLRKLPGVAVDAAGNVTVNGRKVDKIQVDGRDFFNPNIKTALENLPGAIIEKVQVTPSKDDAQANTSMITSPDRNLTINLQLKKANKKGKFGDAGAAYGTQQLYQGDVMLNTFNEGHRYSARANVNKGNQGGYLSQRAGWGLNINEEFGKKIKWDANYQGSTNDRNGTSARERQNILPDSSFLYNTIAATRSGSDEHQVNTNINIKFDTLQRLNIRPELSWSKNVNDNDNNAVSTTMVGELINRQKNLQRNSTQTTRLNNSANYSKTSRDRNTNISLSWSFGSETAKGTFLNQSENTFGSKTDTVHQQGDSHDDRFSNNAGIGVTQKIFKSFRTSVYYGFAQSMSRNIKNVYNADHRLDSSFSIDNRNTMMSQSPNVSIGYSNKKIAVEVAAGWTFVKQQNNVINKDTVISIDQKTFTPTLSTQWNFAKSSSLTGQYSVGSSAPSPDQLAPVPDNSNPLYITKGNPNLKTSFYHNANVALQYYSPDLRWFANMRGGGTFVDQPIVSDNYFDDSGRQVSTWRNAATRRSLSLNMTIGRSIKVGEWNWQITIEADIRNSDEPGYINTHLNKVSNTQLSPKISMNMNYATTFFMSAHAEFQHNQTMYSLSNVNNITYDNKNATFNCTWAPTKKIQISPGVSYYYNAQMPKEFQRSQTLLNASVNYYMLKANKLSIGVAVNDILNNGVTTSRSITPTAIETTQVNVVRRYAFFTARYHLSQFGGSEM
jgi:hypothetical protein